MIKNNTTTTQSVHVTDLKQTLEIMRLPTILLFALIAVGMYGCPKYNVWQKGLEGQAELARAEQNKKIRIAEAQAIKESSESLAQAEIIRARGVAEANKIIGDSLKGNEAYLRYLYINSLADNKSQNLIYIPTEAGLPILEAGRGRK